MRTIAAQVVARSVAVDGGRRTGDDALPRFAQPTGSAPRTAAAAIRSIDLEVAANTVARGQSGATLDRTLPSRTGLTRSTDGAACAAILAVGLDVDTTIVADRRGARHARIWLVERSTATAATRADHECQQRARGGPPHCGGHASIMVAGRRGHHRLATGRSSLRLRLTQFVRGAPATQFDDRGISSPAQAHLLMHTENTSLPFFGSASPRKRISPGAPLAMQVPTGKTGRKVPDVLPAGARARRARSPSRPSRHRASPANPCSRRWRRRARSSTTASCPTHEGRIDEAARSVQERRVDPYTASERTVSRRFARGRASRRGGGAVVWALAQPALIYVNSTP